MPETFADKAGISASTSNSSLLLSLKTALFKEIFTLLSPPNGFNSTVFKVISSFKKPS